MVLIPVAVSALVVGFLAGLLAFRQKSRWCPTCGATFDCPERAQHEQITGTDGHVEHRGNAPTRWHAHPRAHR